MSEFVVTTRRDVGGGAPDPAAPNLLIDKPTSSYTTYRRACVDVKDYYVQFPERTTGLTASGYYSYIEAYCRPLTADEEAEVCGAALVASGAATYASNLALSRMGQAAWWDCRYDAARFAGPSAVQAYRARWGGDAAAMAQYDSVLMPSVCGRVSTGCANGAAECSQFFATDGDAGGTWRDECNAWANPSGVAADVAARRKRASDAVKEAFCRLRPNAEECACVLRADVDPAYAQVRPQQPDYCWYGACRDSITAPQRHLMLHREYDVIASQPDPNATAGPCGNTCATIINLATTAPVTFAAVVTVECELGARGRERGVEDAEAGGAEAGGWVAFGVFIAAVVALVLAVALRR